MTTFPFRPPARITLAADAQLAPDLSNGEYVWTLYATAGTPPALSLGSTYGLQVQSLRFFPYLELDEQLRADPATFAAPPRLIALSPSYAKVECEPFSGLALVCEYLIAHPKAVVGRLHIHNRSPNRMRGILGLGAILQPLPSDSPPQPFAPFETAAIQILTGKVGNLTPLLFMTGGAEGSLSPFPSLRLNFDLPAEGQRRVAWAHTALEAFEEGLDLARRLAAIKWEPLLARLAVASEPLVSAEDTSSERTWALARGKQTALRSILPLRSRAPFVVTSRLPDRPAPTTSAEEQAPSILEIWHLATGFLLPTAVAWPRTWVDAFLASQRDDGFIPWRPWDAKSRFLASPLLVELAYRAYRNAHTALPRLYAPLLRFVEAWFTLGDANQDGFPEWAHPLQMGLADPPAFSPWRRESVGADFAKVESPALYALLYNALERLEQMAAEAEETFPRAMQAHKRRLQKAIQEMWDARRRAVLYRDFATHKRHEHLTLGKSRGKPLELRVSFNPPARPVVHIFPKGGEVRPVTVTLRGLDARGRSVVEDLRGAQIAWFEGRGVVTAERVYRRLDMVSVDGLVEEDRFTVLTTDLFSPDISLLLPFWAGMLNDEQNEAMRRSLTSERDYARRYGAPVSPRGGKQAPDWMRGVFFPWNAFAIEGLLAQGWVAEAAALLEANLDAATQRVAADGVFWEGYHAESGRGQGSVEHLLGTPPVALLMATAGVHPISPQQVRFLWPTPFNREIRFRFWGWQIARSPGNTTLILPDGSQHKLSTQEPFEVTLG